MQIAPRRPLSGDGSRNPKNIQISLSADSGAVVVQRSNRKKPLHHAMPEMLPELFDSEYFLWAEAKAGVFPDCTGHFLATLPETVDTYVLAILIR